VLEAAAIAALGMVAAFAIYFAILSAAAAIIRAQTGVVLNPFATDWVFAWAPAALIGLSALAGVVPGVKAYQTHVAEGLAPDS